jgi:hypothetical protein
MQAYSTEMRDSYKVLHTTTELILQLYNDKENKY